MRDPRLDPYTEDVLAELTPEAQHRMRPLTVTEDDLGPDRVQPRDAVMARSVRLPSAGGGPEGGLEVPGPRYTAPAPPPAELGFDLAKWRSMSRAERRAVLRYARKRAPDGR